MTVNRYNITITILASESPCDAQTLARMIYDLLDDCGYNTNRMTVRVENNAESAQHSGGPR